MNIVSLARTDQDAMLAEVHRLGIGVRRAVTYTDFHGGALRRRKVLDFAATAGDQDARAGDDKKAAHDRRDPDVVRPHCG